MRESVSISSVMRMTLAGDFRLFSGFFPSNVKSGVQTGVQLARSSKPNSEVKRCRING